MWITLLLLQTHVRTTPPPDALAAVNLKTEYKVNPIGLDHAKPRLSWQVVSGRRGERQSAYRILVATDPRKLSENQGDLWDSGKVNSGETTQISYGGQKLGTGQRAHWKVLVWGTSKLPGASSSAATFEMGLMDSSRWKAQWIGAPDAKNEAPDLKAVRWIWTPEGNPAATAPPGLRFFRKKFDLPPVHVESAKLGFAADDTYSVTINGKALTSGRGWTNFGTADASNLLKATGNEIAIECNNDSSRAGLAVAGEIRMTNGTVVNLASNSDWEASIDGKTWGKPMDLAPIGGAPYGQTKWGSFEQPATYLRKTFTISKPVFSARLYSTARGLYELHLNGRKVSEDIFRPGWTDYHKRIQYQTYDVTKDLKVGSHGLGIVLGHGWYAGHVGLTGGQNYGPKPLALAQLEIAYTDGTRETIATDGTWRAGYGPITANDLLMGETYDARKELGDWTSPQYQGEGWTTPVIEELGTVPLVAQQGPSVRKYTELKPKTIAQPTKGAFVYDLGQNMVGWARLKVKGAAGTTVRIRFAEMLNPDGTIYTTNLRGAKCTDYYTLSGKGTEVYEPRFTFHGFRYVELTGFPGTPGKDAVTGVVITTDTPRTGTFATSDPLVNQLQSNIEWGQRGNYLEVPTDCPQRDERLGWMGDAQVFIRTASANSDVADFMNKWVQDVVDAQSPAGGFPDVAPRMGAMSDGAPAWGDAGVIVPWTVYRVYGDKELLARHYDAMAKWIEYIDSVNPNHLWVNRSNNNFGDWLNANDDTPRPILGTAYFAYSTSLMAEISRVLGKREEAAKYAELYKKIAEAFNKAYVDEKGNIQSDTQTSYVVALRFGLLPESKRAYAAKRLADHIMIDRKGHLATGFVGVGYLNPTLTANGYANVAYTLLLQDTYPSWGYSIRQGATTIWERWDGWTKEKGFQDPGMNSFNHYSLGSVGEWMYSTVAGIDLHESIPAYKEFIIKPVIGGGLKWAKGSIESVHGRIESSWKVRGKDVALDVVVPTNTIAMVHVPADHVNQVREGKTRAIISKGVQLMGLKDGYAIFKVGGGRYAFRSKLPVKK